MGFSTLDLGSHIFVGNCHGKYVKFQYFNEIGRNTLSFKLPDSRRVSTRPLSSKFESIEFEERTSPAEVKKEIELCYELIRRLGKGVVYLGSSRMGPGHSHYSQTLELGREIATLLDCTTWSGAGPGLMDAATKGAIEAGKPVGGFKIGKEAGEWTTSKFHPYLPSEAYLTCRFFSARKHGLVDAALRRSITDRTAVVALPGGIGTLDEMFEILALIQLERIGSEHPVPFLLMNYDSFYLKLLDFLEDCKDWGTVFNGEVASLWKVCNSNSEALAYLSEFYNMTIGDKDIYETESTSGRGTIC
ncbi:probable cytokinin riboside 5'-monophosphate phosphoribohydrolase LOGL2 isoform X1 [Humulus lupulus]|uniref:probable cytokinin riboside 5'-monophosphate phosphoribohydrolase LOGL2 isoform X1 n=1 Tax=Humulus lupulus TaxID=3486 RepID=UPI002B403784|nr:probable cytokinin riboside 5'-monophosphate phosphoribohydrolase LOGL2 isoform X1 [Humulus lupulus]